MTTAAIMPGFTLPTAAPAINPSATAMTAFGDLLSAFTGGQGEGPEQQAPAAELAPGEAVPDQAQASVEPLQGSPLLQGQPTLFAFTPPSGPLQARAATGHDNTPLQAPAAAPAPDPGTILPAAPAIATAVAVAAGPVQEDHPVHDQDRDPAVSPAVPGLPVLLAPVVSPEPEISAVTKEATPAASSPAAAVRQPPAAAVPQAAQAILPETIQASPAPAAKGAPVERAATGPGQATVPGSAETTPAPSLAKIPERDLPAAAAQTSAPAAITTATAPADQPAAPALQLQDQKAAQVTIRQDVPAMDVPAAPSAPDKAADGTDLQPVPVFLPAVTDAPRTAAPAAPPAPAAVQQQPMAAQLARPLFTLASEAPGEHIMTLKVSPEDLGPVTVRAHISTDGVRLELFAAGDAGRDAVRNALPDLRRELVQQGLTATLDLSGRDNPGQGQQQTGQQRGSHGGQSDPYRTSLRMVTEAEPAPVQPVRALHGTSALDVVA